MKKIMIIMLMLVIPCIDMLGKVDTQVGYTRIYSEGDTIFTEEMEMFVDKNIEAKLQFYYLRGDSDRICIRVNYSSVTPSKDYSRIVFHWINYDNTVARASWPLYRNNSDPVRVEGIKSHYRLESSWADDISLLIMFVGEPKIDGGVVKVTLEPTSYDNIIRKDSEEEYTKFFKENSFEVPIGNMKRLITSFRDLTEYGHFYEVGKIQAGLAVMEVMPR